MRMTLVLSFVALFAFSSASAGEPNPSKPKVILETSNGKIVIELSPDLAPVTVQNFLDYVKSGFYDNTVFHRVIPDFMIQGGGFTQEMTRKETRPPIKNEADNGLRNDRGTVSMARTQDPHSATAQFFINIVKNDFLNHRAKDSKGWGYTVFGKVIEGMDIVDSIAKVKTSTRGRFRDVPVKPVIIRKARILMES